ncbi:AbrB family transcriptional regulator [uncultured Roseibium sp.]|uniref:AbrB family transcriptional regulator n=1 Tax=uncultured Roseibium sp. TaxID=1936171 RepID=UPI002630B415|nr:AbrB family transcriptional regulator [uncultured Roseibium sp.]
MKHRPAQAFLAAMSPQLVVKRVRTPLATLAIASLGGAAAAWIGLPLPWLIGAQISLCAVALMGVRLFGQAPSWPAGSRGLFLPILGLMVGSAFTMEILQTIPDWWPSLLALTVFLVVAHGLVFAVFLRIGRYDIPTAFFASFPGGFLEAILLGVRAGGDERIIQVQHFLRISLIVFLIPIGFWLYEGQLVGSMSDVAAVAGSAKPVWSDYLVLALAGISGTLFARRFRLPAPDISGAVLFGATVNIIGLTHGATPPQMLIAVTQLVVGTSLGVGFVGIAWRDLVQAFGLSVAAFLITMSLALGTAIALHDWLGADIESLLLALAPGGLAEMSLIALTLSLSVPFVVLHHLYRITFTVLVIPHAYRFIRDRFGA